MSASNGNQALGQSSYNTGARKKRIACDACHISKVRCTGETNGCQRCRRGDKFCHYSESNMGRTMDGVQKRRKSSAPKPPISTTSTASHGDIEEFDWTSTSSASTSTHQTDPFSNAVVNSELERLANGSTELWDGSRSLQHHDLGGSLIRDLDDMDFEDMQPTLLDTDFALNIPFPPLIHSPFTRPSTQQKHQALHSGDTASSTARSSKVPDAQVLTSATDLHTWTTLLEQLSRPPDPSPMPLDTLLHTTSTLLPRALRTLHALPPEPARLTPLLLILLCLRQAIALFEQCSPSGTADLVLRLGAFQVDGEVQEALQKHIVGKELARMLHVTKVARKVLQLPGVGGVEAEQTAHGVVVDELLGRVKALGRVVWEKGVPGAQVVF
ncbi:hypothetical protein CC80DRAFT_497199 [Byssothecium circinans]|uniref:Zn(2)-C6 fungal-type domain-containing protein n=1 Tax=Byssothecium circinans TaxID=147558 RepID=A0A6A5TGC9_9PLEO|nr:hypothetical protein CC80DRAFT_497199 [Byssothecium circinans]